MCLWSVHNSSRVMMSYGIHHFKTLNSVRQVHFSCKFVHRLQMEVWRQSGGARKEREMRWNCTEASSCFLRPRSRDRGVQPLHLKHSVDHQPNSMRKEFQDIVRLDAPKIPESNMWLVVQFKKELCLCLCLCLCLSLPLSLPLPLLPL